VQRLAESVFSVFWLKNLEIKPYFVTKYSHMNQNSTKHFKSGTTFTEPYK